MEAVPLHAGDASKRTVTRALRYALFVSVALAAVLLAMLAVASGNGRLLESHYGLLLGLNTAIGLALLVLAGELARRLWQRWRAGLFGTRLMMRLAIAFIVMTLLPVGLMFAVAVQFLGRSVESWYDVPMERALESGLTLGRASLDSLLIDLQSKTRSMAAELADIAQNQWAPTLNRMREQAGAQEAVIVTGSGRIVVASGGGYSQLVPDLPSATALRQARNARVYSAVEPVEPLEAGSAGGEAGGEARGLKLRVVQSIPMGSQFGEELKLLQLVQPVPPTLAENAEAIQQGWRDYQQLALSRAGLKRIFRITMTVTLLLTVFSSIAASFLLAGWMTGPLSMIAAGTRAVAEGDFRPVKDYTGRDELGVLTSSFNAMTRQLEEARALVERNQQELERANARLASVLANLTAGVIVLDEDFRVSLANSGAERILEASADAMSGRLLAELPRLGEAAPQILAAFAELEEDALRGWQRQLAFRRDAAGAERRTEMRPDDAPALTLLARGARLPSPQRGWLVVFDDVSEVVSAQRAVAWSEVARRLAHEIKNPLTPIQLAAERMQSKLADKLPPAEAEILARSSQTIVNQVGALKLMVDEFRDYARLPAARMAPLELNAVVQDVLALYAPVEAAGGLHAELAPGLPRVLGDATQVRQVIVNLVKNALEATEKQPRRAIEVVTEAVRRGGATTGARLVVRDDGPGFSAGAIGRVFEPYVTTKPKGTGLGLAIVRKIVEEHGARIEASNRLDESGLVRGAAVSVVFTRLAKSDDNCGAHTTLEPSLPPDIQPVRPTES
jgi:nitrogen fixation/metabolism regulation signal transduction histidine kinase